MTTDPRHPRTAPGACRGGFTLLELVLVMAILCVLAAVAVPSLRGFAQGRRVDDCAAQIVALARWARTEAMTRGVEYRLNVDTAAGTYWLTAEQPADARAAGGAYAGGVDGTFGPLGEEFGRVFTAPAGVSIDWAAAPLRSVGPAAAGPGGVPARQVPGDYVRFLPTGRTDPAAIRVRDSATGETAHVACLSAAELFRVLRYDPTIPGAGGPGMNSGTFP